MGMRALTAAVPPGLNAQGADRNTQLPIFHWKGFDGTLYKLLPEDIASN